MKKVKIEIIIPDGECGCSYSVWITKVWDVINKFEGKIETETITSDTDRAKKIGIGNRGVVVNGLKIPVFLLEEELKKIID